MSAMHNIKRFVCLFCEELNALNDCETSFGLLCFKENCREFHFNLQVKLVPNRCDVYCDALNYSTQLL